MEAVLADAGEVADPVAVRVGEAPDVDLVDDRVAPPGDGPQSASPCRLRLDSIVVGLAHRGGA